MQTQLRLSFSYYYLIYSFMLKRLWIKYKLWSLKRDLESIDCEASFFVLHLITKSQYIQNSEIDKMLEDQKKYRHKRKTEIIKQIKELKENLDKIS